MGISYSDVDVDSDADTVSWAAVTRAAGFDTFAATPSSANLQTLITDETGSGLLVFATSPSLTTPLLGTPTSGNLSNCTAYPTASLSGLGTGVATALAVNIGSAGAPVVLNGALGTPSSGTLTNCTGLPNASVVGLGTAALVNTGTSGATAALNNGANIWSARQAVAMTTPWSYLSDTSQAVDAKNWSTLVSAGTLYFQTHNDALSSGATWLSVPRSGNTPGVPAFTLTPTVAGDPVMTRGATETLTGIKSFTNATPITFARATFDQWQLVHGTANTTPGWGVLQSTAGAYAIWCAAATRNVGIGTVDPTAKLHVAGTVRFSSFGAGTLVTDASGNITASSDEQLKYVTGNFKRGLADLRAMDGPVQYQWKNEQIDLAEAADAIIGKTADKISEAERRSASLTREETTYTGWTAQGVRKGIPEAVKAGPDGLLNFDERPVLAAMYNALLEMAARVEALEAAQ